MKLEEAKGLLQKVSASADGRILTNSGDGGMSAAFLALVLETIIEQIEEIKEKLG